MFARHERRREYDIVLKLVLWTQRHGQRQKCRPAQTYIHTLTKNTGSDTAELETCMKEGDIWRLIVTQSGTKCHSLQEKTRALPK